MTKMKFPGLNDKAFESQPSAIEQQPGLSPENQEIPDEQIDLIGANLESVYSFVVPYHQNNEDNSQPQNWAEAIHKQFRVLNERQDFADTDNKVERVRTIRAQLRVSLRRLLNLWERLSRGQQEHIAGAIIGQVVKCPEGLQEMLEEALQLTQASTTFEQLLCKVRTDLAKAFAGHFLNRSNFNTPSHGVHNYTWILRQAYNLLGTFNITNYEDVSPIHFDRNRVIGIKTELVAYFAQSYQLHNMVFLLQEAIENNVFEAELGPNYESYLKQQCPPFDSLPDSYKTVVDKLNILLKSEGHTVTIHDIYQIECEDDMPYFYGINWDHIKQAIWHKLQAEQICQPLPSVEQLAQDGQAQYIVAYHLLALIKLKYNNSQGDDQLAEQSSAWIDDELKAVTDRIRQANCFGIVAGKAVQEALNHQPESNLPLLAKWASSLSQSDYRLMLGQTSLVKYPHAQAISQQQFECFYKNFFGSVNRRQYSVWLLENDPQADPPTNRLTQLNVLSEETLCTILNKANNPQDSQQMRGFLQAFDVKFLERNNVCLVHWLVAKSIEDGVRILLDKNPKLADVRDNQGKTPLHFALDNGDHSLTGVLLEYGASIATEDKDGLAPADYQMLNWFFSESMVNINRKEDNGWRPLKTTVVNNNQQAIIDCVNQGADINMVDKNGLSLLHKAVSQGAQNAIEYLIERFGLQVDTKSDNEHKLTSLHVAAIQNKNFNSLEGIQAIEYLLKNGAVNVQDILGNTPLYYLIENYDEQVFFRRHLLIKFISYGADPGIKNEAGQTAIDVCNDDQVKTLLRSNQKDENGQLPLEQAILSNDPQRVEQILDQGALLDLAKDRGYNSLHRAAQAGCDQVIDLLVDCDVYKIAQKDEHQRYPVELAIANGHHETFTTLLRQKKKGHSRRSKYSRLSDNQKEWLISLYIRYPDYQSNMLLAAIQYNRFSMADTLLKNINPSSPFDRKELKDDKGNTLLNIVAHQTQHYDCARLLFNYGASVCIENNQGIAPVDSEWLGQQDLLSRDYIQSNRKVNGQRPLIRAIEQNDLQTFKELIRHKAEVDLEPADGFTPLYLACQKGNAQMVYILIRCGAKTEFSSDEHNAPLSIAVQQGYSLIVEILLNNLLKRGLYDSEAEPLINQASRDSIVKMIRGDSFNPHQPPRELALDSAIDDGDSAKVTDLLAKGALAHAIDDFDGNTRMHQAAILGGADVVEALITHGVNPSILNQKGLAAMHLAAHDDKSNVIETMARLECDINIPTLDEQLTPLHIAAKQGHVESVKQLHAEGAHLEALSVYGKTPLHLAIQSGHLPVINELIERGASLSAVTLYGDNPIHLAIKYVQSPSVLERLIHSVDELSQINFDGLTPVHLAAQHGQLETLRYFKRLLINNAYSNASQLWRVCDNQGNTPLHLAALHHHTLAAKWFLQNGLQLIDNIIEQNQKPLDLAQDATMIKLLKANQKTQQGQMQLFEAIEQRDLDKVKSLLADGALVDIWHASTHNTPMHSAARWGNVDIMEVLLEYDAIDQIHQSTNVDRMQPLHLASFHNQKEAVRWLIKQGADINATDKHNRTPIDLSTGPGIQSILVNNCKNAEGVRPLAVAIAQQDEQKARELIDNGAMIDLTDDQGNTALHQAIDCGCEQLAGFMVRSGCDVDPQNKQGDTPLNIAARTKLKNIIALLLNHNACIATENQSGVAPIDHDYMCSFVNENKRQANLREENTQQRPLIKLLTYHLGPTIYGGLKLNNPQHKDKVEEAIDNGAEIHARCADNGQQPLHLCAKKGYQNIVPVLCTKGADVNAQDFNGQTPLHLAARTGHVVAVRRLIDHGAQYDLTDKQGQTPLDYAAKGEGCNSHVANELTKRGADPNTYAEDVNSGTLRHERAQEYMEHKCDPYYGRYCQEVLSPLVNRGSASLSKDAYNQTLLHFASSLEELKATKRFMDRLCQFGSLNSQDYRGQTPLHKMAEQLPAGLGEAGQWLYGMLNRKAQLNIKDVYGKTWLDYIGRRCKLDEFQSFVSHAIKKKLGLQSSTLKQAFKEHCWHQVIKPELFRLQRTDPHSDDAEQFFKAYHPQCDNQLDNIWDQLVDSRQGMTDKLVSAVEQVRDHIQLTGVGLVIDSSAKLEVASNTNGVRLSSSSCTLTGVRSREDDVNQCVDEQANAKAARLS